MYIKANEALSSFTSSFSHHSSIYSSSLLSYFYSAESSSSSDTSELIYHEASSQGSSRQATPTPLPPPLPKRNSNQSNQLSVTYPEGPDQAPLLRIAMPSSNPESRRTSMGEVTHELHKRKGLSTPQSEVDSLVLESKQYVQDIRARRDNIHATLRRGTGPGDKLRRLLGYRLEQRLVKVSQGIRKSRTNSKKRSKRKHKPSVKLKVKVPTHSKRSKVPLIRKISHRLPWVKTKPKNYILGDNPADNLPSDIDQISEHSSPRFIVDRQGTFRWPPISVDVENQDETSPSSPQARALSTTDNFTLARPKNTSSEDSPSVLGWLQVTTDRHVFTPALASPAAREGPFKKAPFHANMHLLKTKI